MAEPAITARRRRAVPPPRWVLLGMLLAVLAGVLLVNAYTNASFTPDHQHSNQGQREVPTSVVNGGPIISANSEQVRSYRLPDRTIALTFDDGPDPVWTPEVLRVLDAHQVTGTFFVLGSQVARHPDMARNLVAGGHELGVHTFTHPDLTELSGWRQELEYAQTQLALAAVTGVRTSLVRFPYSSHADAIDNQDWPVLIAAGDLGYLTVLNDTDSQDWALPGVDKIVENATPDGDSGAITLWHDAGGDRAQTVAALDRFIPMMKQRGYRFVTATDGLNLAFAAAGVDYRAESGAAATAGDRWRGQMLVWAVRGADQVLTVFGILFVLVGVLTVGRTAVLFLLAGRHARRRRATDWTWGPPVTAPVSVIVPAYNEKEGIAAAVRSLAGGDHPGGIEVVVVDDGSTDGTADIVDALRLPNVRVVRKPNGGKPSALNTGVAFARHDLIVMVDGDTVFEPDAVRRLVQPFADPQVGAVAGNVKVGNRRSLIAK
ncbi:glycosyltransferase, partial [Micromonospora sp. M51]